MEPELINDEVWMPVKEFYGMYEISSHGRCRSLYKEFIDRLGRKSHHKGKIIKTNTTRQGYLYYILSNNSVTYIRPAHRLVAKAFLGESNLQVNHKDRVKTNNHISNLEYVTPRQNTHHCKNPDRELPLGVTKHRKRYRARICQNGKQRVIGSYETPEEASMAFRQAIIDEDNLRCN